MKQSTNAWIVCLSADRLRYARNDNLKVFRGCLVFNVKVNDIFCHGDFLKHLCFCRVDVGYGKMTWTGVWRSVVVPSPNCPCIFLPQALRLPSSRIANECKLLAATDTTSFITCTGL